MTKSERSQEVSKFMYQERKDLKEIKEHLNQTQDQHIGPDWQFFDELQLPLDAEAGSIIDVWLTKSLQLLDLQADFMSKVLRSAQETVERAVRAEPVVKIEHIYIILFVQAKRTSESQSWGFFRVEKTTHEAERATALGQTIEFYLYLEGQ